MSLFPERPPRFEEVMNVVETYFGTDAQRKAAEGGLSRWGNMALPHLREMAEMLEEQSRRAWAIVVCIGRIGTPEAMELLVRIARGETRIESEDALNIFFPMADLDPTREALRRTDGFKEVILGHAKHESFMARSVVARISGVMKWPEAEPVVRTMLDDEVLSVREAASAALEMITGETSPVRRPTTVFPKSDLRNGRLKKVATLPKAGWMTSGCAFTDWFDGDPALLHAGKEGLNVLGTDTKRRAGFRFRWMVHEMRMLPSADPEERGQLVCLVSDREKPIAEYAVSVNSRGDILWKNKPLKTGVKSFTLLYGEQGRIEGIALGYGGDTGIVAVDLKGEPLWEIRDPHVLYRLLSHPGIPGVVIAVGGGLELLRFAGSKVSANEVPRSQWLYATDAALLADADGRGRILAAGSGESNSPELHCLDLEGTPLWAAPLSHNVGDVIAIHPLEGMEGGGGTGLFAAATAGGELLLIRPDGTLLCTEPLSDADAERFPVYGLSAGLLDATTRALVIGTLQGGLVYQIMDSEI